MNLASTAFLEADSVNHYLYSRFAWDVPPFFFDPWARPARVMLHFPGAHLAGVHGAKAMSLLAALATAALTWRCAIALRLPKPELAGVFVLAGPMAFLHSFDVLTELPFAALLAATLLAYARRQFALVALLAGALPLARPEGFACALLAAGALVAHGRYHLAPLAALPILAWDLGGWRASGMPGPWYLWLYDNFPYGAESTYKRGHPLKLTWFLPAATGPLLLPAVAVGAWTFARDLRLDHVRWCRFLVAFGALGFLAAHSALNALGKLASNGEPRYLLAVAPLWALLACAGWPWLTRTLGLRRHVRAAAVAAALLPWLLQWAYPTVPLRPHATDLEARGAAAWYASSGLRATHPTFWSPNPIVLFALDAPPSGVTGEVIDACPPGTVYVWDEIYSMYNADPRRVVTRARLEAAGWRRVEPLPFAGDVEAWAVYASPDAVR